MLGTPPAFVLSQDQTLHSILLSLTSHDCSVFKDLPLSPVFPGSSVSYLIMHSFACQDLFRLLSSLLLLLAQRPLIYHANPFFVKFFFKLPCCCLQRCLSKHPLQCFVKTLFSPLFRQQCCLSYHPLGALSRLFSATFRWQRCLSYCPFWELSRLIFSPCLRQRSPAYYPCWGLSRIFSQIFYIKKSTCVLL